MSDLRNLTVTMAAGVEQFRRGMVSLGEAISEFMGHLRRWHEVTLPERRALYGGDARWAFDENWHSAMCGAWLHDQCPNDEHDLRCACFCHRRK